LKPRNTSVGTSEIIASLAGTVLLSGECAMAPVAQIIIIAASSIFRTVVPFMAIS
jgi:hypothetical protein